MLLALRMVLTIAVLALPVRSVVSDDLGERYTEGLGHAFWVNKNGDEGRGSGMEQRGLNETCTSRTLAARRGGKKALLATPKNSTEPL